MRRGSFFARVDVIAVEGTPEPSRLEPNDRIRPGIEPRVATEDGERDVETLELVGSALQRFLDQKAQQVAPAGAALKARALQNSLQLFSNRVPGGYCRDTRTLRARGLACSSHRISPDVGRRSAASC